MNKEKVISIINGLYPKKKITNLVEFPDCYVFRIDGEQSDGLVNWKSINKETGKFEYRSFFDLDDENMKKII